MTASNAGRLSIVQDFIEAYNRFDVESMMKFLHPDIEFRNVSNGTPTLHTAGLSEFRAQAESACRLFSARRQRIQKIEFGDDRIEVAIEYAATLAVDLPNGVKAGGKLELSGRSIYRFSGDAIIGIEDIS